MKQMSGLSPLPREMLYTRAADEIRQYIEQNQLQEGDRLPAERALADALGISTRTVESYFARIQVKMGLEGMRALRQHAIQHLRNGQA